MMSVAMPCGSANDINVGTVSQLRLTDDMAGSCSQDPILGRLEYHGYRGYPLKEASIPLHVDQHLSGLYNGTGTQ
jgi:hypothetical protein